MNNSGNKSGGSESGTAARRLSCARCCCAAFAVLTLCSCTDTRWNQKQQLNDPIMQLDASASGTVMRGHILTPREASIGGFSSGGAGGCGCN